MFEYSILDIYISIIWRQTHNRKIKIKKIMNQQKSTEKQNLRSSQLGGKRESEGPRYSMEAATDMKNINKMPNFLQQTYLETKQLKHSIEEC